MDHRPGNARCAVIAALTLCSIVARGATVTGTIQDAAGNATTARVAFYPLTAPLQAGDPLVISGRPVWSTATNGVLSLSLAEGLYQVQIGQWDKFKISVPSGSGSYEIGTLTEDGITYIPPWASEAQFLLWGSTNAALSYGYLLSAGTNVVLTTNANAIEINSTGGGSGDFLADGSVPMTGMLSTPAINGITYVTSTATLSNALASATNGSTIVAGPGTYSIATDRASAEGGVAYAYPFGSTLQIESLTNVTLLGSGPGTIFQTLDHGSAILVYNSSNVVIEGITFRGIGPEGTSNTNYYALVALEGTNRNVVVRGNRVESSGAHGVAALLANHMSDNCMIVGNHFEEIGNTNSATLTADGAGVVVPGQGCIVAGNYFTNCFRGIEVQDDTRGIKNSVISHNMLEGCYGESIVLIATSGSSGFTGHIIENNVIYGPATQQPNSTPKGIWLQGGTLNRIAGNYVERMPNGYGIVLRAPSDDVVAFNTVEGNTVYNVGVYGLALWATDNVYTAVRNTVRNNLLVLNGGYPLMYVGGRTNDVTGNTLRGSGGVGIAVAAPSSANFATDNRIAFNEIYASTATAITVDTYATNTVLELNYNLDCAAELLDNGSGTIKEHVWVDSWDAAVSVSATNTALHGALTAHSGTVTNTLVASVVQVDDDAYAVGWNGSTNVPTKNALYDKIETLSAGSGDDVFVNGANVTHPDFDTSADIAFGVSGTNVTATFVADSINADEFADADWGDVSVSSGTVSIDADSVALATDTTGNYVATIADSGASEVTVANSGTENAAVTLAIAAGITRDTEWDSASEINAATTDDDFVTLTGVEALTGRKTFQDTISDFHNAGTVSGAVTLSWATNACGLTASGNVAVTMSGSAPASGDSATRLLRFAQDGSGSHTLTVNGASVAVDPTASAVTLVSIHTIDAGVNVSTASTYASVPTTITVADTTDTTSYVALWESATGDLAPKSDGGITYNAGTGVLTATGFSGPLTGNVTGNADTATTATTATTANAGDSATAFFSSGTVEVSYGGTGASTLTDGGVLLGSGTGAITAMSVLADGEMIVGDGTTDPVAESGATLRTSIGVGTGDSPQFTGIELGHATDTTLARAGAGDVTIEGNSISLATGDSYTGAHDFGGATSIEVPNGTDPDVDADGEVSFDTDDESLRVYDGTNQRAIRSQEEIHVTVITPNSLDDTERDAFLVWENRSGFSFIVTGWSGFSDTDDTTLNIETTTGTGASNATVDAVEIATDGTGVYYASDTSITAGTIANGSLIWLDFDDTDAPGYVKMTIWGYYDANVD